MCCSKSSGSVHVTIKLFEELAGIFPHDVIMRLMGVTIESAKVEIGPNRAFHIQTGQRMQMQRLSYCKQASGRKEGFVK